MIQHAQAANARLLKAFPKGFSLDATHHPHVTMLQQFVRTSDLDNVYAAANQVLARENPRSWKMKAFKYYYIPSPPLGLAGIVVEPTDDLLRLQRDLIDAVAPFTVKTGTPAAFFSTEEGRDIQEALIDYVANFVEIGAGKKFNPHVTIGVGTETYLKEMLAEPFEAFTFSPASASVYQLGSFGTARGGAQGLGVEALTFPSGKAPDGGPNGGPSRPGAERHSLEARARQPFRPADHRLAAFEPPTATFYSKGKTRLQSLVILTTVQPFALASSRALSSFPMGERS